MPFKHTTVFDSDTLNAMTAAYDSVVATLNIKLGDPRTSKLASLIISLAKAGVVDPERLADQARAGLKQRAM